MVVLRRLCVWCVLCMVCVSDFAQRSADKPLFTFACLSDIHNQQEMIRTDLDRIRLRSSFVRSLELIGESECIDALVLGGDFMSDVTLTREQWLRTRELMAEATNKAFPVGAKRRPVIYVTGNHDYEVANFDMLPKGYNAGDFYSFPMMEQTGVLRREDCFWEMAYNGDGRDSVPVLAAFHYRIGGFDFVVQNCGKHFFRSAWDYRDSEEAAKWVERKLREIDPKGTKTVFYLNHLPLPDSRGATVGKTLVPCRATSIIEGAIREHRGLVYIYGHDHSSRKLNSFITDSVAQRVTQYGEMGPHSVFMGSMRYNSLDVNASPGVADSPIVQGLIVRVYRKRIVLEIRNFSEWGELNGKAVSTVIAKDLVPYTIDRLR